MSCMRHRSIALIATAAALAAVALLGRGAEISTVESANASPAELAALVDELGSRPTRAVVRRLEESVRQGPTESSLTLLGFAYHQQFRETGDPSWLGRAAEALRRAGASGGGGPLLDTARAQLAVTQHRFEQAIPLARAVLAVEPEDATALGVLGDALLNTGRYRSAFRVYDRLASLGPSVGGYARVAVARRLLGRPGGALDAIELALEAGSGIPEQTAWAEVQHGVILLAADQREEAERAFRRALALRPGYVHARAGLARVDAARGEFGRAARRLEGVVATLPSPEYAILLGDAWQRAGDDARARRAYASVAVLGRLLETNGVRTELQTALFDLDHGRRVPRAAVRARAAYAAAPSVHAADAVSWSHFRLGDCVEARRWSKKALGLGTRDGLLLFHRGLIERCLSGPDAARPWMRAALAADPYFSLRWEPLARRLAA